MKIADFGIAEILQDESDEMKNKVGTIAFMAPETLKGFEKSLVINLIVGNYNAKQTDIWAAGGTLYYFLVGKIPF